MKKGMFFAGLILLIAGTIFASPDDTREAFSGIGVEEVRDNLLDDYNSTYDGVEGSLGENTDIASYGVIMIGLLLLMMSVARKKDKGSGLLYQTGDKQNISPELLERTMTQNSRGAAPHTSHQASIAPSRPTSRDSFELPDLGGPAPTRTHTEPLKKGVAGTHAKEGMRIKVPKDLNEEKKGPVKQSKEETISQPSKESRLCCPNCNQGFTLKGRITEVICPRCGKRFATKNLK